jgi:hypothetical protein
MWYIGGHHHELSASGEALMHFCMIGDGTYRLDSDVYHPRFVRVRDIQ